eukprot:6772501-Pyramimonas_sp.AAC.1
MGPSLPVDPQLFSLVDLLAPRGSARCNLRNYPLGFWSLSSVVCCSAWRYLVIGKIGWLAEVLILDVCDVVSGKLLLGCSILAPAPSNVVFLAWSRMPWAMVNLTTVLESVFAVLIISGGALCRMRAWASTSSTKRCQ